MRFQVQCPAMPAGCDALSRQDPSNPALTWPYVEAMNLTGCEALILGLQKGEPGGEARAQAWVGACTAFTKSGRLNRLLEIASLPVLPEPQLFWNGLLEYCRRSRISQLSINSFGSIEACIPTLPGEASRLKRTEFLLDLPGVDLMDRMRVNHRQSVRRAEKAGLALRRTRDIACCAEHLRLAQASLERRRNRGEDVEFSEDGFLQAALTTGAAEMFQAVLGDLVVSSMVVLRAPRGGYLHSSGTDPEGMKIGASHYLNFQIARILQSENCELYNLGGCADPKSGLGAYKAHFGSRSVTLEAADFYVGPAWKKKLSRLVTSGVKILGA